MGLVGFMGRHTEAINAIGDYVVDPLFGGFYRAGKKLMNGGADTTLKDALKEGFASTEKGALTVGEDNWHAGKIAGGVAGLGIGYRFLSGGGAYRDKNGNTDIAGLPFV